MSRLAGKVVRALVVGSAILAVLSAGLWVRSRFVADVVTVRTWQRFARASVDHPEPVAYSVSADAGALAVDWRRGDFGIPYEGRLLYPQPGGRPRLMWAARPAAPAAEGFGHGDYQFFHRGNWDADRWVRVPLWFVAAALASPAVAVTLIGRRRRSVSPFACRRCGYDLRATPGRCPECGAIPVVPTGP